MSWKEHLKEVWEESRELRKKSFREFTEMLLLIFCMATVAILTVFKNKESFHIALDIVHARNWGLMLLGGVGFLYCTVFLYSVMEKILKLIWWILKYILRRVKNSVNNFKK